MYNVDSKPKCPASHILHCLVPTVQSVKIKILVRISNPPTSVHGLLDQKESFIQIMIFLALRMAVIRKLGKKHKFYGKNYRSYVT